MRHFSVLLDKICIELQRKIFCTSFGHNVITLWCFILEDWGK
ncbi:hypothetical protein HMPREF3208_00792 [Gardnerella vaginalis]|uniref:Uncharacterized protein n=1 Tax=Gardnerella vaginalis TaxID=2702 RepID=A0A133NWG7_GARVA|nr:hypothetical protein HMPREF3208_00792 [Gardnerella vaginalis]